MPPKRLLLTASITFIFCATSLVYVWIWSKSSMNNTPKEALAMSNKPVLNIHHKPLDNLSDIFVEAAERHELRQHHLRNYCLKHGGGKLPSKKKLKQFLVDDENKIIICSIAKVASTPWKMTLLNLRGKTDFKITESSAHTFNWKRLSQFSTEEISNRLTTHFKFVFVREPLHRMLSAYKDKFFGKNRHYTDGIRQWIVQAFRPKDVELEGRHTNNVTFSEFLEFISSYSNSYSHDSHWLQYESACFPCQAQFDFIGYFETLADDAAFLLKKAGIDQRVVFPPVPPSRASSDFVTYYSQVPYDVLVKFAEAYQSDFEMFAYPFPGPLKGIIRNGTNGL